MGAGSRWWPAAQFCAQMPFFQTTRDDCTADPATTDRHTSQEADHDGSLWGRGRSAEFRDLANRLVRDKKQAAGLKIANGPLRWEDAGRCCPLGGLPPKNRQAGGNAAPQQCQRYARCCRSGSTLPPGQLAQVHPGQQAWAGQPRNTAILLFHPSFHMVHTFLAIFHTCTGKFF